MKICYKNICITWSSIALGLLLSFILMCVYSNNRIIINNRDNKNNIN